MQNEHQPFRFSVLHLMDASVLAALVFLSVCSSPICYLLSTVTLGILAAIRHRHRRPVRAASISGVVFAVCCVVTYWPIFMIVHFFRFGEPYPYPYFGDSFAYMAVVGPIVFTAFYTPLAAAVSGASGWITHRVYLGLTRAAGAESTSDRSAD